MSANFFYNADVPHTAVASAGGVSACLNTTGALSALQLLGPPSRWSSLWCCSGSAGPMFMWGAGKSPVWVTRKMLEYDFGRLFPQTEKFLKVAKEVLRCEVTGQPLTTGLRDSTPYGYRIQKHCPDWPLNVKTMATSGKSVIVFDCEGIYRYLENGVKEILSTEPASVSDAVRATGTIPGLMKPITCHGYVLQDGALSEHTACPTTLATIHDGTREEDIIALLSAKEGTRKERWKMNIGRHLAGSHAEALDQHARLMIKPLSVNIRTTEFVLPKEKKEAAILEGFHATMRGLQGSDLIKSATADEIIAKTATIDELCAWSEQQFGA